MVYYEVYNANWLWIFQPVLQFGFCLHHWLRWFYCVDTYTGCLVYNGWILNGHKMAIKFLRQIKKTTFNVILSSFENGIQLGAFIRFNPTKANQANQSWPTTSWTRNLSIWNRYKMVCLFDLNYSVLFLLY